MVVTIYEKLPSYRYDVPVTIRDVDKVTQTATGAFELILKDSIMFIPSEYIVVITELEDMI